mgnify:CR=1 FL=1
MGSTSNLQSRLNVHLSSFKKGTSKCSSVKVLENNNFSVSVLRDKILNHDDAKIAELNFINAFGPDVVNANKPITCSKEEYTKKYQREYYKKRKLQKHPHSPNQVLPNKLQNPNLWICKKQVVVTRPFPYPV